MSPLATPPSNLMIPIVEEIRKLTAALEASTATNTRLAEAIEGMSLILAADAAEEAQGEQAEPQGPTYL